MGEQVYLNGRFVPYEQALIPVEDRAFLFADGIYEVVKCYRGRPFRLAGHLDRLEQGAAAIRLQLPRGRREIAAAARELVQRNGLAESDCIVYVQVTRGVARRNHPFPRNATPTEVMLARPLEPVSAESRARGARVITVEDLRWLRCDIKSVALLPNVLAAQAAVDAGVDEALLVRQDGRVTEGSHTNVFAVIGGTLRTHPADHWILGGITRKAILEVARELGIPVEERPFTKEELLGCDEAFLSSTTQEALGIVEVDGRPIGGGKPGPVVSRMYEALMKKIIAEVGWDL